MDSMADYDSGTIGPFPVGLGPRFTLLPEQDPPDIQEIIDVTDTKEPGEGSSYEPDEPYY